MPPQFSPAWLEGRRVTLDSIDRGSIVGVGHVMAEVDSLIGRLRRPDLMEALDLELPRGVLLWGLPGLGKTLVARYIATAIGSTVPFYEVSSDELTPDRMRCTIRWLSQEHRRSVLYLDEIDQWGLRRSDEEHSPRTRLVLTAALAALDGLVPARGPIVIASSNRPPRALDRALVRSGRLGVHIEFDLPDEAERVELLRLFVGTRPTEGVLDFVRAARLTRGRTPADLKALVADAYGLAVVASRPDGRLDDALLTHAIRRGGEISGDDASQDSLLTRRWAIHESAHVAACVARRGPDWVYSVVLGTSGGTTSYGRDDIAFELLPDAEQRDALVVAFAGLAGEQLILGDGSLGAEDDIRRATAIARRRLEAGLDPRLPFALEELGQFAPEELKSLYGDSIEHTLADARAQAASHVETNRAAIERFADELERARELVGEELATAIARAGFTDSTPASAPTR